MDEITAYCGLVCNTCPIYLATRESDPKKKRQMRVEIAQKINELYKEKMRAEDVTDCDGCMIEDGRLFSGCHKCEIRKCARGKVIENCAYCDEYPCKQLKKFFDSEPDAKARLDMIRNTL
jgi:hypothetical protein